VKKLLRVNSAVSAPIGTLEGLAMFNDFHNISWLIETYLFPVLRRHAIFASVTRGIGRATS